MEQYRVHLDQFDGPLDLLLHLIKEAKLDIKDVHVAKVTEQYMEYMEHIGEIDLDAASEFISMAATLLYIKSRSLIPRPHEEPQEGDETPEQALVRQLREYQAYKQASEILNECWQKGGLVKVKLPEEYPLPPPNISVTGLTLDDLFRAFTSVLLRASVREETHITLHEVKLDEYTVSDRAAHIRRRMRSGGKVAFFDLFQTGSRMEVVATFMALLELLAAGEVRAQQDNEFSEIMVEINNGGLIGKWA